MARVARCHGLGWLLLGLAAPVGCANSQSSPPSSAQSEAPPPEAPLESSAAPPAGSVNSVPPAEPVAPEPVAPEPAPLPSLVEVCGRMCDRMRARCSESAIESCRMNCTQYEHPPAGCEERARTALECASGAEDLTCVNIAPESCAPKFRRVVACASGKPDPGEPVDPTRIPQGWQRFEALRAGFSVPLPLGVVEGSEAGFPLFSASQGPVTYSVRVLPAPEGDKPTQKSLVKVTLGLVGACARKLKLYGMVEREDKVSIRFDSKCPNGNEWRGMLVIAQGKLYVLRVVGPAAFSEPVDPFLYNFHSG